MRSLNGIRVAVLESRRSSELAELVRRLGGDPYPVPAMREVAHLEQVPAFLSALAAGRFAAIVCLTGVGVQRLLREADRVGRLEETIAALKRLTIVCRGPKPVAALRQYDLPVHLKAAAPHTTAEVLEAMKVFDVRGKGVVVLHYGERDQPLADALAARGAQLEELCLYDWQLPEEIEPLKTLVNDLIGGRVEAIAVTSQIQCRNLFEISSTVHLSRDLRDALNRDVIVAAIGPVCASALEANGVCADVVPAQPTMGALIVALAEFVEREQHH
jgi:uroporphyrinogen-III synthase